MGKNITGMQAEAMHESVGLHYSIDYPAKPVNME